jgi:Arc/MetJ-type ribon-helix-helix transcriptional regulator
MDQAVRQLVETGQYKSVSDVIRDALVRFLKENPVQ